ncbi:unnamed protein product [Macrosiphum euphorbiae]|uniref:Uncharacterized protein n=1 Tax=Macrosiphum euphorbiae TaxID=13131 RepID=A0AAV0XT81_9HEMI|nr:unnamed protein product [Macrosiphum euphorbiae]
MSSELTTEELVAIAVALEEDENKIQKKRKYSVHPLNKQRKRKGLFHLIYDDLRVYPEKFFSFYRMSMPTFDELRSIVRSDLLKMENLKNDTITPEERLTITIKYVYFYNYWIIKYIEKSK